MIRRFRGKEICSGDSEERDEPERVSGLSSEIMVLLDCVGGRWRSVLSLMVVVDGGYRWKLLHIKRLAFIEA